MKKLTITEVGEVKLMETKYGPKNKFNVRAKEERDKLIEVWLNPKLPVWKGGESHEVEDVVEKSYNGKITYSAKLPKYGGSGAGAAVMKVLERIENAQAKNHLFYMNSFQELAGLIKDQKAAYPTPEKEGLDPKRMANFDHTAEDANLDDLDTF